MDPTDGGSQNEARGCLKLPELSTHLTINHHAFFVIFDSAENREDFLDRMREKGIYPYSGYIPLHSSKMGRRFGYRPEDLPITENISQRIVRLPFYTELAGNGLEYCIEGMGSALNEIYD